MEMIDSDYDSLTGIVSYALTYRPYVTGTTKKAEEMVYAQERGYLEGVKLAITCILNEMRAKQYADVLEDSRVKLVPAVNWTSVNNIIVSARSRYKAAERDDKEQVVRDVIDELSSLVVDESLDGELETTRRRKVLQGDIEPVESDYDWLRKEREALAGVVDPYDKVLSRLAGEV